MFDIQVSKSSSIDSVDFENISFGQVFSDHLFVMDYEDGVWKKGSIQPFGPMTLNPATMALHYGQTIFEGMKAYRQPDGGVSMFRPGDNINRFNISAVRMCMPEVPEDIFDVGESSTTAHTTEAFMPMDVVDFSLFIIAENFKGFGGFLEMTFCRFIARIFVRVILESHFSIGLLDLGVARIASDSENLVVISSCHGFP